MLNRLILGSVSLLVLSTSIAPALAQNKLFLINHNSDANSSLISQNTANVLKTGAFVSGEHSTTGNVQIINRNGQKYVVLNNNFKTDTGPDLYVILHKSNNVIGSTKAPQHSIMENDYVELAPLEKTSGTQEYMIPANVDLANYQSVAIWCHKFNATFGAATLK